jgi:hypothetical protein
VDVRTQTGHLSEGHELLCAPSADAKRKHSVGVASYLMIVVDISIVITPRRHMKSEQQEALS